MAEFLVKIEGAEYKVSAPNENTAWEWANQTHASEAQKLTEPYDLPAGVKSAMNVGQALTFGFGDEIAGAMGADKGRYRSTLDQFSKEYPKSSMLGTVSGSMLLPFGAALKSASPLATAATVGGVSGILQGAGDAPNQESMSKDAVSGGVMGMALGPAMALGMKPIGSTLSALSTKLPLVGDALTEQLARSRVAQSFMRDSTDATQVGRRMVELGPEARFADAAGENTRGLLDLNANLPGKTKDALENTIRNRIATRPERMDSAVYAVNGGYGRAGELEAALTQQQQKVAGPLYQKVHSLDVAPTPQLIRDMEAARKLGAFNEAQKRSLANPTGGPFSLDPAQQVLGQGRIGVRDIDHIKQGIDSLIDGQTDAMTGKVSGYGRDLVALKKRILAEVDSLVPDYAAARNAYAGPASLKSAIDRGRSFWNEKAPRLEEAMADMSKSEQEAFRVGASEALRERVGSQAGQNQLLNLWKDRNTREKLQALLGNDVKYSEVQAMLRGEETLRRMEGLGPSRNSRTFSREAAGEDQTAGIASEIINAGTAAKIGAWPTLIGNMSKLGSRVSSPEPVRDAIGNILLKQYAPAEMKALMEAQEIIRKQQAVAGAASGVVAGKGSVAGKK